MKDNGRGNCELFDFMAHTVGLKVLHPGGYKATDELCSNLRLDEGSHILDVACGTGTTTFYLSKKYGCKVTGFDISEALIDVANRNLEKSAAKEKLHFDVANALDIPYPDNSFDAVISQAFFILIDDKEKALKEILRVLKPGGYFGALELSWFKTPSEEAYDELVSKACNALIPRVVKFEEWEAFFGGGNLTHLTTVKHPMTSSMLQMLETEGFLDSVKIMLKMLSNSQVRIRMMNMQKAFSKYNNYLGYGIYCCRK